ncbi:MAG TPA: hypothetical protein VFU47_13735 [Armatimonadota bacterium]|jgi:hypothetical protein|nr:hypothetical protein [Armatimonadota bacterium]
MKRWYSGLLAVILTAGTLLVGATRPVQARSNSKEKAYRIGTYIGSAATIYALAKGKGTWALIGGGATLLSYTQWRKEMKRRHRNHSAAAYRAYRTRWLRQHRGHRIVRRR